jgi:dinuclear metal center YbgI/SA1388 family protein
MNREQTTGHIFGLMEQLAPKELAYDWDPVGLQVGSYNKPVRTIMVTLDVLEAVVDEAIEKQVDMIIAHHPLLFKSVRQINTDTSKGRIIQKLLHHDITVYASHTNLDIAENGVNDAICNHIGVRQVKPLVDIRTEQLLKLVAYIPLTHVAQVRDAISEAGAGHIGNYSHCTFQTQGQGTFKPLEGTNPFIGSINQLEKVDEVKLESIIQESKLRTALHALLQAHPYEEPAYDIFPLKNKGKTFGLGRIGKLDQSLSLEDFCEHIKSVLQIPDLRVTGNLDKQVRTVAVIGGSGEKYIHQAKQNGADVYITGDMSFHYAQDAQEAGLAVIDVGHYAEKVMKTLVKKYLDVELKNTDIKIITSTTNTDPFQFI